MNQEPLSGESVSDSSANLGPRLDEPGERGLRIGALGIGALGIGAPAPAQTPWPSTTSARGGGSGGGWRVDGPSETEAASAVDSGSSASSAAAWAAATGTPAGPEAPSGTVSSAGSDAAVAAELPEQRSSGGSGVGTVPSAAGQATAGSSALAATSAGAGFAGGQEIVAGEEREAKRPAGRGARNGLAEGLFLVMTALLLALTLKTYVAEAYEIKGSSMLPTLRNGERVVVLKSFFDIQRGDVVIFASTEDPAKDLIKRVIGLPGEEILIRGGQVFVDGAALAEDYLGREADDDSRSEPFPVIREKVKLSEIYVLGDNRGDSHDSRRFHGVPLQNVKGKVLARWWPLDEIRSF